MEERYVSFETAKMLKEKGFTEECQGYFEVPKTSFPFSDEQKIRKVLNVLPKDWNTYLKECVTYEHISIPTHQMATDWIRTKYKIHISPYYTSIGWYYEIFDLTRCDITGCEPFYRIGIPSTEQVGTYGEAVEKGIKHVLEHLI